MGEVQGMSAPTFAKVENGIVTQVNVVTWEFLTTNPHRYGDSSLWIECFQDGSARGYCAPGWTYDSDKDLFVAPPSEEDATE